MKRTKQSWSRLRPASHTAAARLGRSPVDHCRHPSCLQSRRHSRCQSARHERCPACQQQSRMKSSVVGRIQRAEQRPQHLLQPGGGRRNCRPGRHSPAGLPCCCEHRLDTLKGPGCTADFPCSPH